MQLPTRLDLSRPPIQGSLNKVAYGARLGQVMPIIPG